MCGREVEADEAALERFWTIDRRNWNPFNPLRFNVAPSTQVPIVIKAEDGAIEMIGARWGLIPHWWKQDKPPNTCFNARSEEATEKPMWRGPLKSHRCLMPIRGWYEWNEKEKVKAVTGRKSFQPYFHYCAEEPVLGVAGIWSVWSPPGREPMVTAALLSKEAAPSVAHIHHRMPVILRPEQYGEWLDPTTTPERVQELIASARGDFTVRRVSTQVNSVKNDGPHLLTELQDDAFAALAIDDDS